jgi:hypothetical protein
MHYFLITLLLVLLDSLKPITQNYVCRKNLHRTCTREPRWRKLKKMPGCRVTFLEYYQGYLSIHSYLGAVRYKNNSTYHQGILWICDVTLILYRLTYLDV